MPFGMNRLSLRSAARNHFSVSSWIVVSAIMCPLNEEPYGIQRSDFWRNCFRRSRN